MAEFESAAELRAFAVETRQALMRAGMTSEADGLQSWLDCAFTTGSEWLGELRVWVRSIEPEIPSHSPIRPRLARLMNTVKDVWPKR